MVEARVSSSRRPFWHELLFLGLTLGGTMLMMKYAIGLLDPTKANQKAAKAKKAMLQARLRRPIVTDQYEDIIACDAVNADSIDVTLEDVGGLQNAKTALMQKIILPLRKPELFNVSLLRQAKGVLLYGPPGTGKTMLAKAIAKEAGASFINIRASTIQSKWFGETQKLTQAIFTLASKLQPCIVFIDEVDALLGRRRETEHDAVTAMKTEFMQLWDGFCTDSQANILVLAATNRPFDLDDAVLRRFTLQLEVEMPNVSQREEILKLILKRHSKEGTRSHGDVMVHPDLLKNEHGGDGRRPLAKLAEKTDGFTGSDLLELSARAAAVPVQEFLDSESSSTTRPPNNGRVPSTSYKVPSGAYPLRKLDMSDYLKALETYRPSTHQAEAYRQAMSTRGGISAAAPDVELLRMLLAQLATPRPPFSSY